MDEVYVVWYRGSDSDGPYLKAAFPCEAAAESFAAKRSENPHYEYLAVDAVPLHGPCTHPKDSGITG